MKIFGISLLICVGYVAIAALVGFVCKVKEIGIEDGDDFCDYGIGALIMTIFWPVGVWVLLGVGLFRALCENYKKSEIKRKLRRLERETEEREVAERLVELERELANSR